MNNKYPDSSCIIVVLFVNFMRERVLCLFLKCSYLCWKFAHFFLFCQQAHETPLFPFPFFLSSPLPSSLPTLSMRVFNLLLSLFFLLSFCNGEKIYRKWFAIDGYDDKTTLLVKEWSCVYREGPVRQNLKFLVLNHDYDTNDATLQLCKDVNCGMYLFKNDI